MKVYKELVQDILENGHYHEDRTGVGTKRLFVKTARFDLQQGFPIVTLKKTYFLGALRELLFFLSGGGNLSQMHESIRHWWRPFSGHNGILGDGTYGCSLRYGTGYGEDWGYCFDPVKSLIDDIKTNPNSRRLVLSSYNATASHMDLKHNIKHSTNLLVPCHMNWCQFQVVDGKLSLAVTCRSQDVFLGTPVNWVEHALLVHILANICDLEVGEYVWVGNDVHIYSNHFEQCRELLTREPLQLPKLVIKRKLSGIDDISEDDFELIDYKYHPPIKGDMAV